MNEPRLTYDCEHQNECRTRQVYPEFCYMNMTDKQRIAMGTSCPIADEYKRVPEEQYLECPQGLMRKFMAGGTEKGKAL